MGRAGATAVGGAAQSRCLELLPSSRRRSAHPGAHAKPSSTTFLPCLAKLPLHTASIQ